MCGLAGAIGNKPDINKLRLLHIYNRSRGTDSCGVSINGVIEKGTKITTAYDLSDSYYFNKDYVYPNLKKDNNKIILHTRASTMGKHTADNAHPFNYNGKFIFAHNGSLKNMYELYLKYGVDEREYTVDSKFLGELIYRNGFKVLQHYKGKAALAMHYVEEDIFYLWKGYSLQYTSKVEEERPLHYYYDKNDECYYYSSEKLPLEVISNFSLKTIIYSVGNNQLIEFEGNKIKKISVYDRSHITNAITSRPKPKVETTEYKHPAANNIKLLKLEVNPQNDVKGKIYCYNTYYYSNGHLLTGKYYIDKDGNWELSSKQGYNLYYFHKGYMLKNKSIYKQSLKAGFVVESKKIHEKALYMFRNTYGGAYIYQNGMFANGSVLPIFGYCRYNINYGVIESISKIEIKKETKINEVIQCCDIDSNPQGVEIYKDESILESDEAWQEFEKQYYERLTQQLIKEVEELTTDIESVYQKYIVSFTTDFENEDYKKHMELLYTLYEASCFTV